MSPESTQFLRRYIQEYYSLKGIIILDTEGIHICSSFAKAVKQDAQKFVQTSTLLISAINQTDSNLVKTKTYESLMTVNFYFDNNLIHINHKGNLMVCIFMNKNTNVISAKEISTDIIEAFQKLNAKIPEIKKHF